MESLNGHNPPSPDEQTIKSNTISDKPLMVNAHNSTQQACSVTIHHTTASPSYPSPSSPCITASDTASLHLGQIKDVMYSYFDGYCYTALRRSLKKRRPGIIRKHQLFPPLFQQHHQRFSPLCSLQPLLLSVRLLQDDSLYFISRPHSVIYLNGLSRYSFQPTLVLPCTQTDD